MGQKSLRTTDLAPCFHPCSMHFILITMSARKAVSVVFSGMPSFCIYRCFGIAVWCTLTRTAFDVFAILSCSCYETGFLLFCVQVLTVSAMPLPLRAYTWKPGAARTTLQILNTWLANLPLTDTQSLVWCSVKSFT